MAEGRSNGNRSRRRGRGGEVPYVSARFSLGVENKMADAGRDSRTFRFDLIFVPQFIFRDIFSHLPLLS